MKIREVFTKDYTKIQKIFIKNLNPTISPNMAVLMLQEKIDTSTYNNQMSVNNQISVDAPIISKNLQKNVISVVAAVTGVVFITLLTYPFIRPHLMDYNSYISNIQNSIKCKNEPQNTLMPGCRNNLYCQEDDPAFERFTPFNRRLRICVNDRTNVLFEGCKQSMEDDVNKYLNSTSYAKQLFDKFYFETVVRLAP